MTTQDRLDATVGFPLRMVAIGFSALAVHGCGGSDGPPAPPPVASVHLSTTALQFGNERVGTSSAAQTVTVTNPGMAALSISSTVLSSPGNAFKLANGCGATLAVNARCTMSFTFTPVATGAAGATLSLLTNAASTVEHRDQSQRPSRRGGKHPDGRCLCVALSHAAASLGMPTTTS